MERTLGVRMGHGGTQKRISESSQIATPTGSLLDRAGSGRQARLDRQGAQFAGLPDARQSDVVPDQGPARSDVSQIPFAAAAVRFDKVSFVKILRLGVAMRVTVILLVFTTFGCQEGAPVARSTMENTKIKPRLQDLVGTYVPTAKTVAFIRANGSYPDAKTTITLTKENTFRWENMPDCWNPDRKSNSKFDSGNGKWTVYVDGEWIGVGFLFESTAGFQSEKFDKPVYVGFRLLGENPYLLTRFVGDPDSQQEMQFEKVEGK